MPSLSIIVGYRNRDIARVERFLASLDAQDMRDFELLFIDYGSDKQLSTLAESACSRYSWCCYIFNNTRGRIWNRSHALNSGLKIAQGTYILFTDVDLILSPSVLFALSEFWDPYRLIFHKAHYLPEVFSNYDSLRDLPVGFPKSSMSTLGLFQCVARDALMNIGGFDEFYAIWGPEDKDLAARLSASGVNRFWMDEDQTPIYHQWHPHSVHDNVLHKSHWWDDMWLHYAVYSEQTQRNANAWGVTYTSIDRRALSEDTYTSIHIPAKIDAYQRARMISHLVFFLKAYPGKVLELIVKKSYHKITPTWKKQSSSNLANKAINTLNLILTWVHAPFRVVSKAMTNSILKHGGRLAEEELLGHAYFILFSLLYEYHLVEDYVVSETREAYIFKICSALK